MTYEFILSCDLETTGVNPSYNDWITGSFGLLRFDTLELVREIDLESRPLRWHEEAFETHKIRKEVAMNFPARKEALHKLIEFLPPPRSFLFLCHANTISKESAREYKENSVYNSPAFSHFDFACLKMDFFQEFSIFDFRKYFNDRDVFSTWTYANNLIDRKILPRDLDVSLEGLCDFFRIPYGKHKARADRISMELIYQHLRRLDGTLRERHSELDTGTSKLSGDHGLEEQLYLGL